MIDVTIQPIGRPLLAVALSAIKYKTVQQQKQTQQLDRQLQEMKRLEQEASRMDDLSFDITANVIDKRFTTSKQFMQTGTIPKGGLQYKKTTTASDREMQRIADKQRIATRVRYNNSVSRTNKMLHDKKTKASFNLVQLKNYL